MLDRVNEQQDLVELERATFPRCHLASNLRADPAPSLKRKEKAAAPSKKEDAAGDSWDKQRS
jgi:hypothetical protein